MAHRAQVLKKAKEMGIDVDDDSGIEITATAPYGHLFAAVGVHTVVASYEWIDDTKAMAWNDIWTDMQGGLERCPGSEQCLCWDFDEMEKCEVPNETE